MMNLTGDGPGFDILVMPSAMREQVPTTNFFQQSGYERNPVAIRNDVVAQLLAATNAKMDEEVNLQGAKDLAAAGDGSDKQSRATGLHLRISHNANQDMRVNAGTVAFDQLRFKKERRNLLRQLFRFSEMLLNDRQRLLGKLL